MAILDHFVNFLSFFWEVFTFWIVWQCCDYGLGKLKVRLKKPWVVDSSQDVLPPESRTL
jgi:hypothetical protein